MGSMKTAALVLLLAYLLSAPVTGQRESRERCICVGPGQNAVRLQLVENIKVYMPSPSCSKQEIIVTLKHSGVQKCLKPDSKFAQEIKKAMQKRSSRRSKTSGPE
ncbi:C-X-C motif chemokine 11-6-like [Denticeps clupeoides]|uniref:C-X-C motif chemokine 11-6-like n=1 Tax=Denticeps clupeoides TaxID=299321 RepID=UPI0010A3C5B3|nr:C-X-C motif chemokine 11-6-like [Denticeps clupeoides]